MRVPAARPGFKYHLKVHTFRTFTVILAWLLIVAAFYESPEFHGRSAPDPARHRNGRRQYSRALGSPYRIRLQRNWRPDLATAHHIRGDLAPRSIANCRNLAINYPAWKRHRLILFNPFFLQFIRTLHPKVRLKNYHILRPQIANVVPDRLQTMAEAVAELVGRHVAP